MAKKTDEQVQTSPELDAGNTSALTAQIASTTAPAPSPATQAPASLSVDEFHGLGGEYEVVDGVRRLVSRTEVKDPTRAPAADVNPPRA